MARAFPAQDGSKRIAPFEGRRLALVIGNKDYSWKPLINPANDARAVAAALREAGFRDGDVSLVLNAGQTELRRRVREFVERVKPGDLAFVYYSGHGVEIKGRNYLLGVDLPPDATETYVEDEAVPAQRILQELEDQGARTRVLILDACRDNPLRAAKSTGGGLAAMEGRGSLIVFATEAGHTAADTPVSANSVFTTEFLAGLKIPGISLDEAMKRVSRKVARDTNGKQIPAIYGLLLEDLILTGANGQAGVATATTGNVPESSPSRAPQEAPVQVQSAPAVPVAPARPLFETPSYRLTADSLKNRSGEIELTLTLESVSDKPYRVYFYNCTLLDENGERWDVQGSDSAHFMGDMVELIPGTRIRTRFNFTTKGNADGTQFTFVCYESVPNAVRRIIVPRIPRQ